MNMGLDKTGNGHPALGVERERGICGSQTLADIHESVVGNCDIAQAFTAPQGNIPDKNIRCHREGSVPAAPANVIDP
jgi:hypothetical protein